MGGQDCARIAQVFDFGRCEWDYEHAARGCGRVALDYDSAQREPGFALNAPGYALNAPGYALNAPGLRAERHRATR